MKKVKKVKKSDFLSIFVIFCHFCHFLVNYIMCFLKKVKKSDFFVIFCHFFTFFVFFCIDLFRFWTPPMCWKRWSCHVFFMFFTFWKVSFFLSFLEVQSRPQTSKKLTFRFSITFLFYDFKTANIELHSAYARHCWGPLFALFRFLIQMSCCF